MDPKNMRDKGQRFLQSITADAENPVYENTNVSRETPTTPINHHVSRETIAITKSRKESRK